MEETFRTRAARAWNAFFSQKEAFAQSVYENGPRSSNRPDRSRFTGGNEQSIISGVYTRIAIDVANLDVQHVRLDENKRYLEEIKSGLNECLTVAPNIDQTSGAFFQDVVMSLFDEGAIAIVPVDTTYNPTVSDAYDVNSMRVGKILEWFPTAVRLRVYNESSGKYEEITLPKSTVAIVENPFYALMNEQNSILKRLIRKLNLLDAIDEQSGSGKLDIIIQMPFLIKNETREKQAEARRIAIEQQLRGSKYGIAYTDGTEKITQLNRPSENNLLAQITFLTSMLYSQLGITQGVLDGTADEATMINYNKRTIEPIAGAIVDSMKRTFISKTARTQGQSIVIFNDPFRLVPMSILADLADKFTRNEITTGNEIRSIIGLKPSSDPSADELRNKNLNQPEPQEGGIEVDEQTEEL